MFRQMKKFLALSLFLVSLNAHAGFDYWLNVNSQSRTLDVMLGERIVERFERVSVGNSGVATPRLQGSRLTPKGTYHIDAINQSSKYRTFYRFDYPSEEDALQAYLKGLITHKEYVDYFKYKERTGRPPQHTKLGGQIGLHGLGHRDEYAHHRVNWTDGCVAVTNDEIDRLRRYVRLGTKVVIN